MSYKMQMEHVPTGTNMKNALRLCGNSLRQTKNKYKHSGKKGEDENQTDGVEDEDAADEQ